VTSYDIVPEQAIEFPTYSFTELREHFACPAYERLAIVVLVDAG
jgi:hypothetical protein